MNKDSDYKTLFLENIILITLCFFVILYIIFNYSELRDSRFTCNNVSKCLLITSILILIIYIFVCWDDEEESNNNQIEISDIPKYKFGNKVNKIYKVVNDSQSKLSNQNIFISHKNKGKYGIQF